MHELNQHKIAALLPQRRVQSNKGSYGSVAAAAGSLAYRGAAALCVEGALRTVSCQKAGKQHRRIPGRSFPDSRVRRLPPIAF